MIRFRNDQPPPAEEPGSAPEPNPDGPDDPAAGLSGSGHAPGLDTPGHPDGPGHSDGPCHSHGHGHPDADPSGSGAPDPTAPGPSKASRRMETLVNQIATMAAYLTAATYQLLVRIREFDELFEKCGFGTGFRTSAEWLAWRTSMSLTAARERVRVARALAELPGTSAAMARGELSYSKVRAICRAAPLDRETEEKLLTFARHGTASHLERLVRSWRRMGHLAEGAEEKARHDRRYLRLRPDEDGSWVIQGRLDPEVGAVVKRALEMGTEALYRRDRLKEVVEEERTGRKAPPDPAGQEWVDQGRRRADALGVVAEAALKAGERSGNGGSGVDGETGDDAGVDTGEDTGDDSAESRSGDCAPEIASASVSEAAVDGGSTVHDARTDAPCCADPEHDSAESQERAAAPAAADPSPLDLLPDTRSERYQVVVHVDLATLRGDGEAEDGGEGGEHGSGGAAPGDRGRDREGGVARDGYAVSGPAEAASGPVAEPNPEAHPPRGLSPDRFSFLDDELRVSAETARRLSCSGSRVVMLNDGKGGLLDVGRRTRAVPSALARAVRFRDRGRCRFPGCTAPGREHHHVVHWARGGETKRENLVLLCWFHHRAVHEGGFTVESTEGGDFRFHHPSGTVLKPAPALPPVEGDPVRWVRERVEGWLEELTEEGSEDGWPDEDGVAAEASEADADGWPAEDGVAAEASEANGPAPAKVRGAERPHRIGPWTITPDWDGRRPDLSIILGQLPPWGRGGKAGLPEESWCGGHPGAEGTGPR
jgi:hypothetical protein